MDIIFDIDGTLADASHRLPYINNPEEPANWDAFFNNAVDDKPIPEAWALLTSLLRDHHRIIFITGRPERTRQATYDWLTDEKCPHRLLAAYYWSTCPSSRRPALFMRKDDWRMPSHKVKRALLKIARGSFDPKIVFEDRKDDTNMWRSEGLFCCQVAEGNF